MSFLSACLLIQEALAGAVSTCGWARQEKGRERGLPRPQPGLTFFLPLLLPGEGEGPLLPVGFGGVNKAGRGASVGCRPLQGLGHVPSVGLSPRWKSEDNFPPSPTA